MKGVRIPSPRKGRGRSLYTSTRAYVTVLLHEDVISTDPWGCFEVIAMTARINGVKVGSLELHEYRRQGRVYYVIFEVEED